MMRLAAGSDGQGADADAALEGRHRRSAISPRIIPRIRESAQRGGDLGFVPMSALAQAPPALRDAVLQSNPGTVKLVSQGGAHTIVLIVAKDKKGQKDLSMPEVKEGISSTLKSRKEQLLRARLSLGLRNDATVINVLAKQIVEAGGKVPALQRRHAPAAGHGEAVTQTKIGNAGRPAGRHLPVRPTRASCSPRSHRARQCSRSHTTGCAARVTSGSISCAWAAT